MTEFSIGDRVLVKGHVTSHEDAGTGLWHSRSYKRVIGRESIRKPFEATVTGETFKREGVTTYCGEDGTSFTPGRAILVVLVRTHPRRKEIPVMPEDLEPISTPLEANS